MVPHPSPVKLFFTVIPYAGSGLPQGPFLENTLFPLKVGFKMGFCKWAEMGPKVGFGVQKWVKSGSKPTFHPLYAHFGISRKPTPYPVYGGWKLFSKKGPKAVPTQHKSRLLLPIFLKR